MRSTAETLLGDPRLCAAVPLLYVAWADGLLTADEIRGLRDALAEKFSDDALAGWLDPSAPPSAVELEKLLAAIRRAAPSLSAKQKRTLASLGLGIAELEHDDEPDPRVHDALLEIEKALGIVPEDAVRALLASAPWPVEDTFDEPKPAFDPEKLMASIDGAHHDAWQRVRKLLARLEPSDDDRSAAARARVRGWLALLAKDGLGALAVPSEYGGKNNIHTFVAAFEALGMFDLSLAVKFGVQFGLFGGSVFSLGDTTIHALPRPHFTRRNARRFCHDRARPWLERARARDDRALRARARRLRAHDTQRIGAQGVDRQRR